MATTPSRAVRFHAYGEPLDVLREERVEVLDPPSGTVRVRVLAAGLNPADWELCRGFMAGALPRGIGYDVAGVVDAVGPDAEAELGATVFGVADFTRQPSAGAADVAVLSAWFPVPDGLDPLHAATLPMVVQTAAWTLELLAPRPGDTLLVHGAGSMVGYAAVQAALRAGVRVIAAAGPTYAADLAGFGAEVTPYGDGLVERVRALTGGADVDHVFDAPRPAPGTVRDLVELAGGDARRVVTISNHAEARELGARVNVDEFGPTLTPLGELLPAYAALAAAGEFRLPVAEVFPLARWRDAVALSLGGHPHGKVVLRPEG